MTFLEMNTVQVKLNRLSHFEKPLPISPDHIINIGSDKIHGMCKFAPPMSVKGTR